LFHPIRITSCKENTYELLTSETEQKFPMPVILTLERSEGEESRSQLKRPFASLKVTDIEPFFSLWGISEAEISS
jgi:hypothetical protein